MTKTKGGSKSRVPKITVMQGSDGRWARLGRRFKNKRAIGLVVIVLLVVIGFLLWKFVISPTPSGEPISSQAYAERVIKERKAQPPASNATLTSKIAYRYGLVENEYTAGNYDEALEDYKALLKLVEGTDKATDIIYAQGAAVYAQLGNKQAALAELDKAETAAKKIQDPMTRDLRLADLQEQRKSIK